MSRSDARSCGCLVKVVVLVAATVVGLWVGWDQATEVMLWYWAVVVALLLLAGLIEGYAWPLLRAARSGNADRVRRLLRLGWGPNTEGLSGETGLHVAAREGHVPVVEALIGAGGNVNARSSAGHTPLDLAESDSHTEVVDFLRDHGALSGDDLAREDPPPDGSATCCGQSAAESDEE